MNDELTHQWCLATGLNDELTVNVLTNPCNSKRILHLAITGHAFIDFECQYFLVALETFHGSHTGQHNAEAINRCFEKYSLCENVRYIVTNNVSNMWKAWKAFSVLEKWATTSDVDMNLASLDDDDPWNDLDSTDVDDVSMIERTCQRLSRFAHTIQLVVKDSLDAATSACPATVKCTKLASLTHQSALFHILHLRQSLVVVCLSQLPMQHWSSKYE